jgi:glycerol-3-phosphate dehydrogenase
VTSDREAALRRLADEQFDVLVIGGGITGAGVALDAASRGLKVALVERRDLASGTSSKSSKLVHGGLRYLQQKEFRLVYQALAERQRLRHTAPHLVRLLPFLIPIFGKDGIIHPKLRKALNSALWMYDLTGGARIGKLHDQIKKDETIAHVPTLKSDRTLGAFIYYDAQTDDARLTMTIARSAIDHGAVIANWCPVVQILKGDDGQAIGARVEADGQTIDVRATTVVNAAGVWSDDVRALDEGMNPDSIRPAKGIHITVPWEKVRNDIACVFPVPKDRRSIFVVPMGGKTYIGTTDTDYDGPIDDPQCTAEDVDYLINAMNASISPPLTRDDVLATWAGLRPLVKSAGISERTADLSRHHKIVRSASGVVSVTGGKLTTYRRMAEDTVDEIAKRTRCRTKKLQLHGADGYAELIKDVDASASRLGISAELVTHLANRHGSDTRVLAAMIVADPSLGEPLVAGLPYVRAEALHAVRHELARTLDDVLTRRIPARWLMRDAASAAAEDVARLIAPDLGWSDDDITREVASFRAAVEHERDSAGLHASV